MWVNTVKKGQGEGLRQNPSMLRPLPCAPPPHAAPGAYRGALKFAEKAGTSLRLVNE